MIIKGIMSMQIKKNKENAVLIFIIVILLIFIMMILSIFFNKSKEFVYAKSLDDTVVTIDSEDIPLSRLTYYIMIEEEAVNEAAVLYDPEKPWAYWNIYVSNAYVATTAREITMNYFLRDYVYSRIAKEEGFEVTENELHELEVKADTIFSGLTDKQASTGLTKEDILTAITEKAYADKYVIAKAKEKKLDITEEVLSAYYGMNSDFFKKTMEEHSVKINDKNWERVPMGRVTIN